MKLFMFKPSKNWTYAGGCLAVAAPDFASAKTLADADARIEDSAFRDCYTGHIDILFESQADADSYRPDPDEDYPQGYGAWVLEVAVPVPDTQASGVVFLSYHAE